MHWVALRLRFCARAHLSKFMINFEQKGRTAFKPINTGQTPMSQSVYNYHSEGKHNKMKTKMSIRIGLLVLLASVIKVKFET